MRCPICDKNHDLSIKHELTKELFKGVEICYDRKYYYCEVYDSAYEDEELMNYNDTVVKDAYRKKCGLMTSDDIRSMRKKYNISQSDLSLMLGWEAKTITRYETHQVQDVAHDEILKSIDENQEVFLKYLSKFNELKKQLK